MSKYWGLEYQYDGYDCNHTTIRNSAIIHDFAKELVLAIDMVAYGDPIIVHFGTGDKAGYTLIQLIETSNITAHFIEETNSLALNVFSCKVFNPHTVDAVINRYFSPKRSKHRIINRVEIKNGPSS